MANRYGNLKRSEQQNTSGQRRVSRERERSVREAAEREIEKALCAANNVGCPIHGSNCPGDDGGFLIDGNHPDDMYSVGLEPKTDLGFASVAEERAALLAAGQDWGEDEPDAQ